MILNHKNWSKILDHIRDERFKDVHIIYSSESGWLYITEPDVTRQKYTWKDDHLLVLDELRYQVQILLTFNRVIKKQSYVVQKQFR